MLRELSDLDELRLALYPELHRTSPGALVRRMLREIGYAPDGGDGATITHGERYSQVSLATVRRMFVFGLWDRGVSYGHGRTDSPRAMVDALAAFVFDHKCVDEMLHRFPFVELTAAARAHERGELVEHRWAELLASSAESAALGPIVREASGHPKLRALLPFVNLQSLHFSRTTGYPYRAVDAWTRPAMRDGASLAERVVPGQYEVFSDEHSLGVGDAAWAAACLAGAVPDHTGPAVDGTADD
jgi:hypothetical protein